ncbi:MAG: ABC transporter substrate-binding protein, partial [Clostridiales bacterium]|nr:ABC transporter substrate-binding protein [Clostridiales bacterium]
EDFGESRPGAGFSTTYERSIQIAKDYPVEKKLVPGLNATAYLSVPELADVRAQMSLLNYNEMLVQAIYASDDAEVQNIVESFRAQLKSAGIDQFKEHLNTIYSENPEAINFYTE